MMLVPLSQPPTFSGVMLVEIKVGADSGLDHLAGIVHVHHVTTPLQGFALVGDGRVLLHNVGRGEHLIRCRSIDAGAREVDSLQEAIKMARQLEKDLVAWAERAQSEHVMAADRGAN